MTGIPEQVNHLFALENCTFIPVSGHEGGWNRMVIVKRNGENQYVLRISDLGDRTGEDYLAETEFVRYLAENGAPAADVIPSVHGRLAERVEADGKTLTLFPDNPGWIPVSGSFGSTATVFIGQNLGADEKKRADRSFWYCILTSCLIGFFLGTGIYLTGRFWLSLFLPNDQLAIDYGMIRMFYIVLFYPIACANSVLGAAIQAHGHAPYTAFSSILCVCVFRLIWMWFIYPHFQVFDMLMACFLVSWLLCLLFNIFGYLLYCKKLFKLPRFKRRRK